MNAMESFRHRRLFLIGVFAFSSGLARADSSLTAEQRAELATLKRQLAEPDRARIERALDPVPLPRGSDIGRGDEWIGPVFLDHV